MIGKKWLTVFVTAWVLLLSTVVCAEERILSFDSDVTVQADGVLDVTETIWVRAEGKEINHGIYRDIPTSRGGSWWAPKHRVDLSVVSVARDGATEPWVSFPISDGIRIKIGDANRLVKPGKHVYRLRYTTTRQIGFFSDYDELYWNVTGNFWAFPINEAEVRIKLPQAATLGNRAVYTGPMGATGKNAEVMSERPGEIIFRTTAPLGVREGLTVAVAWPKGVIAAPGGWSRFVEWVPYLVGGFGLLATLAYYLVAWLRVGRDLPAGPIVPLFTPPDGLSAAAMRYIVELGGMDKRIFSAALVQLGIKGKLRLVEGLGSTTIEQRPGGAVDLGPGEAKMLARLFRDSATISVTNKNHDAFGKAWDFLKAGLRANYEGKLFLRNLRWSWLGFACIGSAIWLTTSVVVLLRMPTKMQYIWFAYGLAVATTITINTLVVKARLRATPTVLNGFFRRFFFGLLTLVLFFGTFVLIVQIGGLLFFEFFIFTMHHNDIGDLRPPVFAPLLALPVAITSFWWMKAPTREGRAVLDRIAGFKQYLSIAEEDRLERLHPPEKTPELFERYLPYAIALGVENKWADRFTAVLAAAAAAATGQASMDWYSGHSHPWSDAGRFVDNVGSSLASSLASASTSPSSDSSGGGSSGGGSSGGGGGGGGGGGW